MIGAAGTPSNASLRFLLTGACWSAGLLIVLGSSLGQRALIAPFAAWQAALAVGVAGGSPVVVDLSCSGSDVIALSIAAILAYPVSWRRRIAGVALAGVFLVTLNTIRIATLVDTAGTPLFLPLHLYIWPAALITGAAAFVFGWIWVSERPIWRVQDEDARRTRTLMIAMPSLIVVYAAIAPWLLASVTLQRVAIELATFSAALLRSVGIDALTGGSTLVVGQRAFLVTTECITTPLMPVYLAWALVYPRRVRTRLVAVALFVPLFLTLSVLRLLTVSFPAIIGSPLHLTHGFYQIVAGALLIVAAVRLRTGVAPQEKMFSRLAAAALAVVGAVALASPYTWLIEQAATAMRAVRPYTLSTSASLADIQGAFAIMPGYELALLCGLAVAWCGSRAWRALAVLIPLAALAQVATLVIAGELSGRFSMALPITAIRALSILTPVALVAAAAVHARWAARR